jgi:hypothetical protein
MPPRGSQLAEPPPAPLLAPAAGSILGQGQLQGQLLAHSDLQAPHPAKANCVRSSIRAGGHRWMQPQAVKHSCMDCI